MQEWRNEVLQAEAAIRQLAEELAETKGVKEQVMIVEQRLGEAASALEQSLKALERAKASVQEATAQTQASLNSATEALRQASDQLIQNSQAIVPEVLQVITRFGEQVHVSLNDAIESIRQASDQLTQSSQALSSSVGQAINNFGERVHQTLQQAFQNMQEQLAAIIGDAQKTLINAANLLTELRAGFERNVNALTQQNEQILQQIAQQDTEIKRLSRWLKFCLALVSLTTLASITVIALLVVRQ